MTQLASNRPIQKFRYLKIALPAVVISVTLLLWWLWPQPAPVQDGSLAAFVEPADTAGYALATEPDALVFPRDFGPHEAYLTEWWYYTGNLATADGREFGYQFTIFRRALTPSSPPSGGSAWRTNQVYLAHLTISDIANQSFYQFEKISRGGAGLAGAAATPYRVWLEDWSVEEDVSGLINMTAGGENVALNLVLEQTQPPVLQGQGGLSPKGPGIGNATYYYSQVNQLTRGTLTINGDTFAVSGRSWKDHEYSTRALAEESIGWDWFSIQLDNAESNALVLWEIRQADGSIAPQSAGNWIYADSSTRPLSPEDYQITVLDTWTSPASGAEYPVRWQITVPSLSLALTAEALMENQELLTIPIYWEGAVRYSGTLDGKPVTGRGYIEMTGYDQPMRVRF